MSELGLDQVSEGWDPVADAYDEVFASFTAKIARDALSLAGVRRRHKVLDVAAGTGSLSLAAAELGAEVLATDFSQAMVERLRANAERRQLSNLEARVMDGQALEVEPESFDAAFSALGLMFFPDRAAGFKELHRALRQGGRAGVVSWSSIERLQFMGAMMRALMTAIPEFPKPEKPPVWASLSDPEGFKSEMLAAGFDQVHVYTVAHVWVIEDPESVFDKLSGTAPALRYLFEQLSPEQTAAFKHEFVKGLTETQGSGPYGLVGEAHIGVGRK